MKVTDQVETLSGCRAGGWGVKPTDRGSDQCSVGTRPADQRDRPNHQPAFKAQSCHPYCAQTENSFRLAPFHLAPHYYAGREGVVGGEEAGGVGHW